MKTTEIDIRGQICPSCLLLVLREVNLRHRELLAGDFSLMILTDNRDATGTIPEAVNNMGIAAAVEKRAGYYRITIQRQHD
jgi:TusA-related sulfurtransferase